MYQWDNNLRVADCLLNIASAADNDSGLQEGATRAAVGRFYYACYKAVDEIVKDQLGTKVLNGNGGSHERTINSLLDCNSSCFDFQEKEILVDNLNELKGYRQQADYNQSTTFSSQRVDRIKRIAMQTSDKLKIF